MRWDPDQYLRFAKLRLRPALDLLARVPLAAPQRVVDLGCGIGEITVQLASTWAAATVLGVDSSESMIDRSQTFEANRIRKWADSEEQEPALDSIEYVERLEAYFSEREELERRAKRVRWLHADIADWEPVLGEAPDLIFSNAALHWLPDHETLFPRLLGYLAPGGCLAVQMPQSWGLPSHRLMRETLAEGGVGGVPLGTPTLRAQMERRPVGEAVDYHALLDSRCRSIDIWETVYLQILTGEDPVLEWVQGSSLRPVLEALEPAERRRFLEVYSERLRVAYPSRADGGVPFPFQRLFIVASV